MAKRGTNPLPSWTWDDEYNTNIRSCPEGYTYVRGFNHRDGTSRAGYCRKLRSSEKSRTVERVRREMEHKRTVERAIKESGTLSDEEWNRKYGNLFNGRR